MSKLMTAFCQRRGIPLTSARFLFDGERIAEQQTPAELDMEDGDTIDVYMEQTGGAH